MNKQQILAPLILMALVASCGLLVSGRNHARAYQLAHANAIANDLTKTNNSPLLPALPQPLAEQLTQLRASDASQERVLLGDEAAPLGDCKATLRIFLPDTNGNKLALR